MNNYPQGTQVNTYSKVVKKYINEETRKEIVRRLLFISESDRDCKIELAAVKCVTLSSQNKKNGTGRFSGSDTRIEVVYNTEKDDFGVVKTCSSNGTVRVASEAVSRDDAMKILGGSFRPGQNQGSGILRELAIILNTERLEPSTVALCDRCTFETSKYNFKIVLDGKIRCESYSEKTLYADGSTYGIDFGDSAIMTVCSDALVPVELSRTIDIMNNVR